MSGSVAINSGVVVPVFAEGPAWQAQVPAASLAIPVSISASATFTTAAIRTYGNPHLAIAATLSQAGTLSIQRYVDQVGSIVTGAAVTQALVAATPAVLDNLGTVVAQSFKLSIINSATVAATPSNVIAVLQSR